MSQIIGRVKIPGPPPQPPQIPFVDITQNIANRVKVENFSHMKNYEKIEFLFLELWAV